MSTPVRVTPQTLRGWPLPDPESSDKHSRGLALVVGGSAGTPGAVRLAAEAALRAGCGKVRIATVASTAAQLGALVPEARVYGLEETSDGDLAPEATAAVAELAEAADVTLLGSGFVDPQEARSLVAALLPHLPGPVVLDALATAYVDDHPDLHDATGSCVLTVNPSELAHVLGRDEAEVGRDPVDAAESLARTSGAVVLLGGETKLVAAVGQDTRAVADGGPGLATAGSGDVQAGLVTGLIARGADPVQAAVWGAWLHARAGDRLAARVGTTGFLARELLPEVPALLDQAGG
jgi:ADP-dependent NAD(P)H-hydrate dehydratase